MTCKHCEIPDEGCAYPHYGLAPHDHAGVDADGGHQNVIGSTRIRPKDEWPDNFSEDPETPGAGIYMHCPECGASNEKKAWDEGLQFYRCTLCSGAVSVWDVKAGGCPRCKARRIVPTTLTLWEKFVQIVKHPKVWTWEEQDDLRPDD